MSVALAPQLWEEVRAAADRAGKSPDDWFADAAEAKLRAQEDAAAVEEAARKRGTRRSASTSTSGRPSTAPSPKRNWRRRPKSSAGRGRRKRRQPSERLVLDAGALIAIDRDDRDVHKTVRDAHRMGVQVLTNSMAVAQVWRDSKGRQAELAKVLRGVRVQSVNPDDGRRAGELLEAAGLSDAIDASVARLAETGDRVPTSDPGDLRTLCEAAGNRVIVVRC